MTDTLKHVHFKLLKFITALQSFFLWLVLLSGIWMVNRMFACFAFKDFRSYIRNPWAAVSLILFLFSYSGMFVSLLCQCLVCKRLRIMKRVIVWSMIWIPLLNYGLAWYVRSLARQEIDHETYKIRLDDVRVEKQVCQTRYPLLLVHGVGFRDFHYFNYWGRIPRELVKNGAAVFYGHQEAWGTVEDNALILKDKIREIKQTAGCEKVNIIAHSKGGLDARYLIRGLHMEADIASLTTINTPHRGSALVDLLEHLPDAIYRLVCRFIDYYFGKLGDTKPDAYTASRQLSRSYAREFNRTYPDAETIYYQSYTSLMKHGFSSKLLCVPYWILKALDGPNDGLVTAESAAWANFRGVITNRYLRGISHGDMIDLTREDYRSFSVPEFYIQLAEDLKKRGF